MLSYTVEKYLFGLNFVRLSFPPGGSSWKTLLFRLDLPEQLNGGAITRSLNYKIVRANVPNAFLFEEFFRLVLVFFVIFLIKSREDVDPTLTL